MKLRSLALKTAIVALAVTAPYLWGQDGLEGALSRANLASPANFGTLFQQTLAAADFDGDNKPDGAILVDYGWLRPQSSFRTIELHFSGRGNTKLTFESAEASLVITALDVNRDGATDVIVEQAFTHKRLQVWLNDGRGGFRKVPTEDFPSAAAECQERLQSSSPWPDCPGVCPTPQRGFEVAFLRAWPLPGSSVFAGEPALPFSSPIASRAGSSNSSRAPPLSRSL